MDEALESFLVDNEEVSGELRNIAELPISERAEALARLADELETRLESLNGQDPPSQEDEPQAHR